MSFLRHFALIAVLAGMAMAPLAGQDKRNFDTGTRSLKGTVTDHDRQARLRRCRASEKQQDSAGALLCRSGGGCLPFLRSKHQR